MKHIRLERRGAVQFMRERPWWQRERNVLAVLAAVPVIALVVLAYARTFDLGRVVHEADRQTAAPMPTATQTSAPAAQQAPMPQRTVAELPPTEIPPTPLSLSPEPDEALTTAPSLPAVTSAANVHRETRTAEQAAQRKKSADQWWADWYTNQLAKERQSRKEEWEMFYRLGVEKGQSQAEEKQ